MLKKFSSVIFTIAIFLISGVYLNTTTTCHYSISGRVSVLSYISKDIDQSLYGQKIPVENAKIKIEQKKCATCRWKKVYETKTENNGDFYQEAITTGNSCESGIRTRVKIKFESDHLELRRGGISDELGHAPKWYTIGKKSKDECTPESTCHFGQMIFRNNNELDLDDSTAIAHADIWYFYNWATDYLKKLNMPIEKSTGDKVRVVYPLNRFFIPDQLEGSYVNPSNKIVHIHEDHLRFDIVMHELAHVWAFNYTSGESVMRDYLFTKFSTHDLVSKPEVAFHEGFADWWMMYLKNIYLNEVGMPLKSQEVILKKYLDEQMNIQSHQYEKCEHSLRPRKRKRDKGRLECHEKGWLNIFQLLSLDEMFSPQNDTIGSVLTYNLYESQNPRGQFMTTINHGVGDPNPEDLNCREYPLRFSFEEVLQIIDGMDVTEMNLADFLHRLKNTSPSISSDVDLFSDITDPTNQDSLTQHYCQNALVVSAFELNDLSPSEWYLEGSYYVKNSPIRIYVKNMGSIDSPDGALLQTPKNYVHSRTAGLYNEKFVPIPLRATPLRPGEETYIEQVLKVKKRANGSFPAVKINYRTFVPRAVQTNNGSKLSLRNLQERWMTNTKSLHLGADLSSQINFARNELFLFNQSSQANISSGQTTTLPKKTFYISRIKPTIHQHNSLGRKIETSYYTTIVGHCTFKNTGNVSSMIGVQAALTVNNKTIDAIQLEPIDVGQTIKYPFEIHLKKYLLKDLPALGCSIDQGKGQKIRETKEFNNIATKVIR